MKTRSALVFSAMMMVTVLLVFRSFQERIATQLYDFGTRSELQRVMTQSGQNLRLLAALDPEHREDYRGQFDEVQHILRTMRVLQHSRAEIITRFERVLLLLLGLLTASALTFHLLAQRRTWSRLRRLRQPLEQLAAGSIHVRIPEPKHGLIGEMAVMIEDTSRIFLRQQQRLRYLHNLTEWQEATRRQAHEINKPLTAARLELERLGTLMADPVQNREALEPCRRSVLEEMEQLSRYIRQSNGLAATGKPQFQALDPVDYLTRFCRKFQTVWPNLRLYLQADEPLPAISADPWLTRQVLMNLCNNSALALEADRCGEVRLIPRRGSGYLEVDVIDNGPGIAPAMAGRLFQPYATTRPQGQGMGLGLAISKKIMLEQNGDLEWLPEVSGGAGFRLSFAPNEGPRKEETP